MTKAEIRNEIKNRIAELTEAELQMQSEELCKIIMESKRYTSCTTLLAYMPLADEADITPVIKDALSKRKKVFLPHVFPGTSQMEFYPYNNETEIKKGDYGISEPLVDETKSFTKFLEKLSIQQYSPAARSSKYVDIKPHEEPVERILVLVPGRAFTKDGKRIGRGKGFYDIYFSKVPLIFNIIKSGVCLECQLMANLPTTPDDIMMDAVYF